ncbi:MAG: hypothetical protein U1B78_00140 [Dehalococcoidia bacterium]|nr:hypothetical protein [Dehalococcoidia bacterium]
MANEPIQRDPSTLSSDLNATITTLDAALIQASRSVAALRGTIAQIDELAEKVRGMEAAITLARQSLNVPLGPSTGTSPPTALRPVPAPEPLVEPFEPQEPPSDAISGGPETATSTSEGGEQEDTEQESQPSGGASSCLRLDVRSKIGSLDLKTVDGSVNENPAVVDVALLDYDGRQATLKLWVNEAADADGVREALLSSLRRRLGDDEDAEITIELEQGSAA